MLTMQQVIRALMQKEEDDEWTPKMFGDQFSVTDEEGLEKLHREPTGDERFALMPGQILDSIVEDIKNQPRGSLMTTPSSVVQAIGEPFVKQGGEQITDIISRMTGKDRRDLVGVATTGFGLAMGMKGGRPPKKPGKGRPTDESIRLWSKGEGPDPYKAGKVGIQDSDYEPRILEVEKLLSSLEPENLPKTVWERNPEMETDANNALGRWRNMLEDLHARVLSDSEQVTAGIKPRDRLFTVPSGFDSDGNPTFKMISDVEKIDTALAKVQFDLQRDLGKYFDFRAAPDLSDDEISLTAEEQKLSDERTFQARADLNIFREGRLAHDNTSDHILGRGTVYYDKLGVARVSPGTSASMLEDPKRISFVKTSEEIVINEEMKKVNKAWDDYGSFTASKMDNGYPQIADLYNEQGVRYRLSNKSDVERYLTMARDGPRTYLIENFNNDLRYLHGDEMRESFIEVDKILSDFANMKKKPLSRAEESIGDLAQFDLIHSLPTLTRSMAGKRIGRTGTMIVDQLMERSRINGSLASQMEILDDMLSPLTPEAKDGYKKSMDISVRQAVAEKAMDWMQMNMGLSRNYLRDTLFRDILGLEEDVFAPYQPRY